MAERRLVGSYPVIGIRPTIDGRRGALDVRGSLEEQTMNMAKSAAKLFEENSITELSKDEKLAILFLSTSDDNHISSNPTTSHSDVIKLSEPFAYT